MVEYVESYRGATVERFTRTKSDGERVTLYAWTLRDGHPWPLQGESPTLRGARQQIGRHANKR